MDHPQTRETPLYEAAAYLMQRVYEIAVPPPDEPLSVLSEELRASAMAVVTNAQTALKEKDAQTALRFLDVTRGKIARVETGLELGLRVGELSPEEIQSLEAAALRVRDEIAVFGGR